MTRSYDKEVLAAYADGELPPEQAAAVVMHLADHPEDQAYVDDLMAANLALARAFAAPAQEPVPDRFHRLLNTGSERGGARILPFVPRRAVVWSVAGALAAALAVLAILPRGETGLEVGPVLRGSALDMALSTRPSGDPVDFPGGGQMTVLATLPAAAGFCREFEVTSGRSVHLGLACREGAAWVVDVVLAETQQAAGQTGSNYLPASGGDAGVIDTWLDRRGAGMALDPAAEAAVIARNWQD